MKTTAERKTVRLSQAQSIALVDWLRLNHVNIGLRRSKPIDVAKSATEALGFEVTLSNVRNLMDAKEGVTIWHQWPGDAQGGLYHAQLIDDVRHAKEREAGINGRLERAADRLLVLESTWKVLVERIEALESAGKEATP